MHNSGVAVGADVNITPPQPAPTRAARSAATPAASLLPGDATMRLAISPVRAPVS